MVDLDSRVGTEALMLRRLSWSRETTLVDLIGLSTPRTNSGMNSAWAELTGYSNQRR
jgi:hypothetical protein